MLETAEVSARLAQNVADEVLMFLIGNIPGATKGAADVHSVWYTRLGVMVNAAKRVVGVRGSDTLLVAQIVLLANEAKYEQAMQLLNAECFPTLGRGRDVLVSLWRACVVGREAARRGQKTLTPVEAHRARKAAPVPPNIGCPYATLYCEDYW